LFLCSYLSHSVVLHPEAKGLSVGQGVASLGGGGLAGRGGGTVAHWSPSRHHYLTASLVLVQRALSSIDHPERKVRYIHSE